MDVADVMTFPGKGVKLDLQEKLGCQPVTQLVSLFEAVKEPIENDWVRSKGQTTGGGMDLRWFEHSTSFCGLHFAILSHMSLGYQLVQGEEQKSRAQGSICTYPTNRP